MLGTATHYSRLRIGCVKSAFSDPPEHHRSGADIPDAEQMWCSDVDFDGIHVSGTLMNQPNWLVSISQGDPVKIAPREVTGWMYVIRNRAYGGFTVNLMRSRMSKSECKAHDHAWGLDFGDPSEIHIVPPEFFNPKKSFIGRIFGGPSRPVADEVLETAEHPMAENMQASFEEFLKEHPEQVHEPDEDGFTYLHRIVMAGSVVGTQCLLLHGANPNVRAKNGVTPLRLAQLLGWKQVVALLQKAGAKA
ncbi:MAG: DUF2314 domain-containing protein [Pirellulales bacterium]